MPTFEADGSIEIHLTPQEFYSECSLSDQMRMREIIVEDFNLQESDDNHGTHTCCRNCEDEEKIPRSLSQIEFNEALIDLKDSWYSISKEDTQIILDITKKYKTY